MIRVHVRARNDRPNLQLYYRDPITGEKIAKSAGTPQWKEAERAAAIWQAELERGTATGNISWDEFRNRFSMEFLAHKARNTALTYQGALNHWEELIGHPQRMSMITPSVVSTFATRLGRKVNQTTVAKNLRHLRAAFRWAESMELMPKAPRMILPTTSKRRLARSRSITRAERRRMLAVDQPEAYRRLQRFMWVSGFRINEAIVASWDAPPIRVDLDSGKYPRFIIYAEGQKSRQDEIMLMAPDCARWLRRTPVEERKGLVAPIPSGRSRASHVIADIGTAAGIETAPGKPASAHDYRRAFGTRWAYKVKPLTLKNMMRHKSIETTLKYYVDLDADETGPDLYGY